MARRDDITPRAAILSSATRAAIEAAGGLEMAGRVTTAARSQLSRCQSEHQGDTLNLRDAEALDRLTLGRGGPHILRALALLLDHVVMPVPAAPEDHDAVAMQLMAVTGELGDVSREIVEALRGDGRIEQGEARRAIGQVDEMLAAGTALRGLLHALAWPEDRP